ncbi:MAG: DUF993 family protein [Planctomycetes bacterium]|nr:DUF993 family protein [Planctomycetota bacterium]
MTRATAPGPGGTTFELDDAVLAYDERALRAGSEPPPLRVAFAAAHVVMRPEYAALPHSPERPGSPAEIAEHVDLEATLALRRRLDAHGFGIAEAMDTAQRFEVGWPLASRLITACGEARLAHGFVAGAGADHVPLPRDAAALADAVAEQCTIIAGAGGVPVILPMPQLVAWGAGALDYLDVYGRIVEATKGPLLVHWLGPMFLASLKGYFPGESFDRVMGMAPTRIVGCKLSLLDEALELRVRRRLLQRGQIVLTGDDFHFGSLMFGGPVQRRIPWCGRVVALGDFSHALLGILDGCARPAGLALRLLAGGDDERAREILSRCEALGRHVFSPPTSQYKAGLALIAWLDGWQDTFLLPNHVERTRSLDHQLRTAELAAEAGVFRDAKFTAGRLRELVAGLSTA